MAVRERERERGRSVWDTQYMVLLRAAGVFLDPLQARRRPNPFHPSPQSIVRVCDCLKKRERKRGIGAEEEEEWKEQTEEIGYL